jgi:hypothetical protein
MGQLQKFYGLTLAVAYPANLVLQISINFRNLTCEGGKLVTVAVEQKAASAACNRNDHGRGGNSTRGARRSPEVFALPHLDLSVLPVLPSASGPPPFALTRCLSLDRTLSRNAASIRVLASPRSPTPV